MRISDWSSDVCSSDLLCIVHPQAAVAVRRHLDPSDDERAYAGAVGLDDEGVAAGGDAQQLRHQAGNDLALRDQEGWHAAHHAVVDGHEIADRAASGRPLDRTSVLSGKSVYM